MMFDRISRNGAGLANVPYQPHQIDIVADLTVLAVVMDVHGRVPFVLPQRARPDRPQWQPPQGRVRHGEVPYLAGIREVEEEIGIGRQHLRYNPDIVLGIQHSPGARDGGKLLLGLFYWCDGPAKPVPDHREVQAVRLVNCFQQLPSLMKYCSPTKRYVVMRSLREATRLVYDFCWRWDKPPYGRAQPR